MQSIRNTILDTVNSCNCIVLIFLECLPSSQILLLALIPLEILVLQQSSEQFAMGALEKAGDEARAQAPP